VCVPAGQQAPQEISPPAKLNREYSSYTICDCHANLLNCLFAVCEDAYWEASDIAAQYVLKKDVIFRISVGGASDIKTKLEKSKKLAQKALARL
jgi:hypothetical protein